jgi:tetratricopeptide (TPR) repeat protein
MKTPSVLRFTTYEPRPKGRGMIWTDFQLGQNCGVNYPALKDRVSEIWMKITLLLLLALAILTGCNTIRSSFNYTEGTQLLEQGEYQAAVPYLEKAVTLGPDFAKNRTNLAYAYWKSGARKAAWEQVRAALFSKYQDGLSSTLFRAIYNDYVTERGLDKTGVSEQTLFDKLGPPDLMLYSSDGTVHEWLYGGAMFYLKEEKLDKVVLF